MFDDSLASKQDFAGNLVRIRRSRKISQKAFARLMDKSDRGIRRWEDPNDESWPRSRQLPKIARALGCTIDELFDFHSDITPKNESEREILNIARKTPRNIPLHFITSAVSTLILDLNKEERNAWLHIGRLMAKRNQGTR